MSLNRYRSIDRDYKPARKQESEWSNYVATFGAVLCLVFTGLMLALSLLGVQ